MYPRGYLANSGQAPSGARAWAALLYAGPGACLACHSAAGRDGLASYDSPAVTRLAAVAAAGGSHALPELQALDLLRRGGLPLPDARQKRLGFGRYYLDLWWEEPRVAVEIDGSAHVLATNWWADLNRQNEITLDGRRILRFPSYVVREQPQRFIDQVTRALLQRPAG